MNFTSKKLQALGRQKELKLSTFLIALAVAACFIVPFMVYDNGYFLFFGDFNVQQIPFYKLAHSAVRGGEIGWSWTTDLGSNFIGSYSFYLLGSPFFWFTLLFPTNLVPYLMGPLLIIKIALSAFTSYCYIRRFTRTPGVARIGALLYAFSGFSVYNIFFNHFHEAIIIFPVLLLAIEEFITENKRGFFAAAVAISAIMNYFFFFGMVVFAIIYWVVRTFSGCYKQKVTNFLWFVFEAVIGLLISSAIMLPTINAVLQNSRVSEFLIGWNGITYGKEQIYLNVLQCFFFPPDLPARPVFFPGADVKWSSLGGWLPLFSMVGVLAYMQGKKRTWLRRIIGISIFMALVPILNSAFYMFNSAYYARWFYMPILLMCLATARSIEDTEINWWTPYKWVIGITAATIAVIGFFPREMENGKITSWGLYTEDADNTYLIRFAITSAIAVLSLVILGILLRLIRRDRKQFIASSTATLCVISAIYGAYFIGTGKSHSYDTKSVMIDSLLEEKVELPGDSNTYRIDVFDGVDNTAMFLGYSSINAFHSVVPASVTEFWDYVGEERGVASRPGTDTVAARALLSVKYLFSRDDGESFVDDNGETKMSGFEFSTSQNGYKIYENQNYVPYGFAYDYYMTAEQCESAVNKYKRSNMMLKAVLLDDNQIAKYSYCTKNLASDYALDIGVYGDSVFDFDCDDDEITTDTAALRAQAVSNFTRTKSGFTSDITVDSDKLVFFSVPYEQGWSAKVNGQQVAVEKVNKGFMAVLCKAGTNTIEFTYKTPYLWLGVEITLGAMAVYFVYIIVCFIMKRKGHLLPPEYPEGEKLLDSWKQDISEQKIIEASEELDYDYLEKATDMSQNESFYNKNFEQGFFVIDDETEENENTDTDVQNKPNEP